MLHNNLTEQECLERKLFGDMEHLNDIKTGDIGFLLNVDKDELLGIFRAFSEAQLHIEPDAWNGRLATQVKVELIGELQKIKDAAYVLKKAGVENRQASSGALAPKFPVHGRDVMEKILSHFNESNNKTPTAAGQ